MGTGIRFSSLGLGSALTVSRDGLAEIGPAAPLVAETREEAAGLPVEQRLRYFDSGRAYQVASARYRPGTGSARQVEEIQISASLNDGLATELAQVALAARWSGRTTVRFALPPSAVAVLPGDVLTLDDRGRLREMVVEEIEDVGPREVTARTLDRVALTPAPVPGSPTPPPAPPSFSPPLAFGLNLPVVDDAVPAHTPWLAVFARPWPGEMGVWRQIPGGAFDLVRTVEQPASAGEIVEPPGSGPAGLWHYGGSMVVRLYGRTLASAAEIDVLSGRNALALLTTSGLWEVIQFRDVELVGERVYRLSTLLRGQLGTEHQSARPVAAGAPFALLDGTLASLPTPLTDLNFERTYRIGPLAEGVGGRNTTTFAFTPAGRGLAPYAPVHGRVRRRPDGALDISWIRRTRIGGDPWPDELDVPLGESEERYRLQILNGPTVVRTVQLTAPAYVYPLTLQTADLGGAPRALAFRVTQLAPGFGSGATTEVTADVEQP